LIDKAFLEGLKLAQQELLKVKQSETKDTQITKEDTDKLPPCTGE